jgi:hypothetical protein
LPKRSTARSIGIARPSAIPAISSQKAGRKCGERLLFGAEIEPRGKSDRFSTQKRTSLPRRHDLLRRVADRLDILAAVGECDDAAPIAFETS